MEADQCSMPVDSSGNYKNFFKVVAVSAAQAQSARSALEAILASYQLNPPHSKKAQQPSATAPKAGGGTSLAASARRPVTPPVAMVGIDLGAGYRPS